MKPVGAVLTTEEVEIIESHVLEGWKKFFEENPDYKLHNFGITVGVMGMGHTIRKALEKRSADTKKRKGRIGGKE